MPSHTVLYNPLAPSTHRSSAMDELRELVVDTPAAGEPNADSGGEMTVEEVIEQHVGSFGFAQLVHVFLVSLAWIFDSQSTLITIFSDAQPEWRCTSSMCHKGMELCHVKPGTWEWVDGDRSSTVAEWGLICGSKFRAGLPASLFFIGSIFGSAAQGRLADDYLGRKMTILLSCLLTAVTTFLTSFSPNLWVYALLRFTTGFARSGIGICCLVLSTEVVGRKWRGQVGNYGFFFFTIGFLSVPAIAYPTRTSWRNLYRVFSLPPLVYSIFIVPFIAESPRWLAIMGRSKEAIKVLTKFAKVNGRKLPVDIAIANPLTTGPNKNESLWSTKWAVRRIILVMIAGLGVGFVYYGVQLNVGNLNFNVYFAVGVNALMEIPAVFLGSVLMSFMNRRALFSLSALLAGASCILCMLFSHKSGSKGSWGQLSVEAFGFMTASMAYDILYIYCVELFPTNVRNFAVSMLRQALMLGAAVAPLLVVLGRMSPSVSYIVFGAFSIFSGLMTWWLPETKNAPLYETLEQQSREETVGAKPAGETEMVE